MHGHPAGHLRPVGDGAAAGQPLHKEHFPPVQHGEVHVLVQHLLDVLHERQGGLAELKRRGITVGELPEPQAQADGTAGADVEEAVPGQLPDEPVRGGQREIRPRGKLRELKRRDTLREGGNQPQDPVYHRIAGVRISHAPPSIQWFLVSHATPWSDTTLTTEALAMTAGRTESRKY